MYLAPVAGWAAPPQSWHFMAFEKITDPLYKLLAGYTYTIKVGNKNARFVRIHVVGREGLAPPKGLPSGLQPDPIATLAPSQ